MLEYLFQEYLFSSRKFKLESSEQAHVLPLHATNCRKQGERSNPKKFEEITRYREYGKAGGIRQLGPTRSRCACFNPLPNLFHVPPQARVSKIPVSRLWTRPIDTEAQQQHNQRSYPSCHLDYHSTAINDQTFISTYLLCQIFLAMHSRRSEYGANQFCVI